MKNKKGKKPKKIYMVLLCFLLLFIGIQGSFSTQVQAESVEKKETYLIRLKKNSDASQWASKKGIATSRVKQSVKQSSTIVTELNSNDFKKMKADSEVEVIEKDQPVYLTTTQEEIPSSTHSIMPWGVTATQAVYAHDQGITGDGIKIAILDTGVSITHPDLRIAGGQTFVTGTTSYEDDNGHGTHVAGIINAIPNTYGVEGMAPNAQVYALKVLDADGVGYYSGIIEAIDWCVANGIQIVSMSFGGTEYSEVLRQVIQETTTEHGILFVAAAGNNGTGEETETYPARYSEVLSVGSVNASYTRSVFSSTGAELDIMAPGEQIWSTSLGGEYSIRSGTSMAAPYAAGAAALVWSADQSLTADQVKEQLLTNAVSLGDRHEYGAGLLHVLPGTNTPGVELPSPEATGSIGLYDHEIRGLMENLANLQKEALVQDNIPLAKEIDSTYNQLNINYIGLRQIPEKLFDNYQKPVTEMAYNTPSVAGAVYDPLSVTQSVYDRAVQSLTYNYRITQLDSMDRLKSDYTMMVNTFREQLGKVEKAYALASADWDDDVGNDWTITAGGTATVSFHSVPELQNTTVEVTGPNYYFQQSLQLGQDYDHPNYPVYRWKSDEFLLGGDYTIKFICKNSQTNSWFEVPFTIHVLPSRTSINIDRPIDIDLSGGNYDFYKFTSSDRFQTINIQTTYYGGITGAISDTVLYAYTDPTMMDQIAYNNDFNGSLFSSIQLTLKPYSTIYIKITGYANQSVHARLSIIQSAPAITPLAVNTSVDRSQPSLTANSFSFTPTTTGQHTIFTGPYGGASSGSNDTMLYLYADSGLTQLLTYNDDYSGYFSRITINMTAGTIYYIVLCGYGNTSVYARLSVQLVDLIPPTVPSNLHITSRTTNSVALQWNASTDNVGVTYYDIYRNGSFLASVSAATLSYTATGLSANYFYTFTVRARDAAGNLSAASNKTRFLYLTGSLTYQYDSSGRMYGIRLPSGQVINYQTDNNGNTKQVTLP